ncbi:SDR family oxidoreductase [Foetidibacter luteolus]|uniref:SDR family oxidoreductase n=1 Tax=Foetidibacter luteolus TaxID=2608880 RepID=UPI00129B2A02|nr:SDR family oxidoreductase [Foetidibacter luteolus]
MQKANKPKKLRPEQQVKQKKGQESAMTPEPKYQRTKTNKKLDGKVAVITGADSGIGRAVAILFAQEGAKVVIVYKEDDIEADKTKTIVEAEGAIAVLIKKDVSKRKNCIAIIERVTKMFGQLDILINNAAIQIPEKKLSEITEENLRATFDVNFFAQFFMVQAAEPYLKQGASIINTTSVTAYRGSKGLLDYSATKGAIVSFTRSLSAYFADKGIRVNAVAPGPIWTPLIPETFPPDKVSKFGSETPMGRAGEPVEVATAFLFLASEDGSYYSGQVLHPNGGEIING